jgi:hypothetical protein
MRQAICSDDLDSQDHYRWFLVEKRFASADFFSKDKTVIFCDLKVFGQFNLLIHQWALIEMPKRIHDHEMPTVKIWKDKS